MSRIGRLPVQIPAGVTVDVKDGNVVTVTGPKGSLTRTMSPELSIEIKDGVLTVSRPNDLKRVKALHGLTRSLIHNMVMVLLINILSRLPSDLTSLYEQFVKGQTIAKGTLAVIIIAAIIVGLVVLVLILNDAERDIPVQYSKKMVGRRVMGGQSSHIPLKVNTGGVIPIIFAASLMSMPGIISTFATGSSTGGTGVWGTILGILSENNWFTFAKPIYNIGLIIYILLVIFFAYFYTSITFNPLEVADNMAGYGTSAPQLGNRKQYSKE